MDFFDANDVKEAVGRAIESGRKQMFGVYDVRLEGEILSVDFSGWDQSGGEEFFTVEVQSTTESYKRGMDELVENIGFGVYDYFKAYDVDAEVKGYLESGMPGVPPVTELVDAIKEREHDLEVLAQILMG